MLFLTLLVPMSSIHPIEDLCKVYSILLQGMESIVSILIKPLSATVFYLAQFNRTCGRNTK